MPREPRSGADQGVSGIGDQECRKNLTAAMQALAAVKSGRFIELQQRLIRRGRLKPLSISGTCPIDHRRVHCRFRASEKAARKVPRLRPIKNSFLRRPPSPPPFRFGVDPAFVVRDACRNAQERAFVDNWRTCQMHDFKRAFLLGPGTKGIRQLRALVGAMAIYQDPVRRRSSVRISRNFWLM